MTQTPGRPNAKAPAEAPRQSIRPGVVAAAIVLCVIGLIEGIRLKGRSPSPGTEPAAGKVSSEPAETSLPSSSEPPHLVAPSPTQTAFVPPAKSNAEPNPPLAPNPSPPPAPAGPIPTAYTRQLVTGLTALGQTSGSLSPEQAAGWKQNFQNLVQQGAVAVPAIQEFLASNTNFSLGPGAEQGLGYGSARGAMIDALAQIGGPEATAALGQTLGAATDPQELAKVAQDLEKLAPGQYQQQAVQAAVQMLQVASNGSMADQDVAPLFQVMQQYGGASAAQDIEQASSRWSYYSAIALGQLPDGSGIASLVQMAQNPATSDPALRMLAQLSSQFPAAADALLAQARQNAILPVTWAAIAPILAGDQVGFLNSAFGASPTSADTSDLKTTHLSAGNQNFYSAPGPAALTAEQVNKGLSLIQRLLSATSDPAAQASLANASNLLSTRNGQVSADPVSGP